MVDLHTHSTYSDGSYTPEELVRAASQVGLTAIALTDHDTVDGLEEFIECGKKYGVVTVPGIEISVDCRLPNKGHMHILGLFIDPQCEELKKTLAFLGKHRKLRGDKIVSVLNSLGIPVTIEELRTIAGEGTIGRPHIAQLLLKRGVVSSIQEAFDRFLSEGKPAYVRKEKITESDAIHLIHSAGGLAILAHPHYMNYVQFQETREKILYLKSLGLDGVEAYYPEMPPSFQQALISLAQEENLVLSGGTDFHGSVKPDISLGTSKNDHFQVPDSVYPELLKRIH